ncbi:TPA: restriction endonuclease subunit S [Campylobacter upsaliensis]|nr:restriction endonuclease subunit S [Campylobacter upsaliensis]
MIKVKDLFDIKTGGDLWIEKETKGEIPVVALGFEDNGIVGFIKKNTKHKLYPKGSITVAGWAGGLKAFVQERDFYVRGRVKILIPKNSNMLLSEKLFYCTCLNQNSFRFAYGRKSSADKLADLLLPSKIPLWVYNLNISDLKKKFISKTRTQFDLELSTWREFKMVDIFEKIIRGKRLKSEDREHDLNEKQTLYFAASELDNGLTDIISNPLFVEKDALIYTIFGDCFYVEGEFTASDTVHIFKNSKMDKYAALFVATVISQNRFKFCYGRQAYENKFENEVIKLPALKEKGEMKPDFAFMSAYIKTLKYSEFI